MLTKAILFQIRTLPRTNTIYDVHTSINMLKLATRLSVIEYLEISI